MTININSIIAAIEAQISSFDSATPLPNMIKAFKAYDEVGGKTYIAYDSAGVLPLADSSNEGMIVYTLSDKFLRKYNSVNNVWDRLDSDTFVDLEPAGPAPVWSVQGDTYGYVIGGNNGPLYNSMDKYQFATAVSTVDVGDAAYQTQEATGSMYSETAGFVTGTSRPVGRGYMQQFSFVSDGNASLVGTTQVGTTTYNLGTAAGATSGDYGFISGAYVPGRNSIVKYPFATVDAAVQLIGTLSATRYYGAGTSSLVDGYTSGGNPPSVGLNIIEKYPFVIDGGSSIDVGDLTFTCARSAGISSETHGYTCGGAGDPVGRKNKIYFASGGNGTLVGNMRVSAAAGLSGSNSHTDGFLHNPGAPNQIQRFPFASDFDVEENHGNLVVSRLLHCGHSY